VLLAFAAALAGCLSLNDMTKAAPRPTAWIVVTSPRRSRKTGLAHRFGDRWRCAISNS
jgi:hypothetical protein